MSIRRVTQLELSEFAQTVIQAEDGEGPRLMSPADVRAAELTYRKSLNLNDDQEIPQWADKYHELLESGVRGRVAAYIAWATMPKQFRWPKTQDELAREVLGLNSDRVIATWRKKFPEIDLMIADLQAAEMLEYRPGAFHALGQVASDPVYRANPDRRLFFEMTRDYTPRQKIEGDDSRGVGRKALDHLRKQPTAKLIELLGEDAADLLKEMEEEFGGDDPSPPTAEAEEKDQ